MTSNLPGTRPEPKGLSIERPGHSAPAGGRIQGLRRSATTPVSTKAMVIGAAVGPVVGFVADLVLGADDESIMAHAVLAIIFGVPIGVVAGARAGAVRRQPRR